MGDAMSLSASQRSLLISLSVASGIAAMTRDRATAKTPKELCRRVEITADAAIEELTQMIESERDLRRTEDVIIEFDKRNIVGKEHTATELLSFALGLLDEPVRKIRNHHKREALDNVCQALNSLARYYDRRLDKTADYALASDHVAAIHRIMETC